MCNSFLANDSAAILLSWRTFLPHPETDRVPIYLDFCRTMSINYVAGAVRTSLRRIQFLETKLPIVPEEGIVTETVKKEQRAPFSGCWPELVKGKFNAVVLESDGAHAGAPRNSSAISATIFGCSMWMK